jgi:hypothetical protein
VEVFGELDKKDGAFSLTEFVGSWLYVGTTGTDFGSTEWQPPTFTVIRGRAA